MEEVLIMFQKSNKLTDEENHRVIDMLVNSILFLYYVLSFKNGGQKEIILRGKREGRGIEVIFVVDDRKLLEEAISIVTNRVMSSIAGTLS